MFPYHPKRLSRNNRIIDIISFHDPDSTPEKLNMSIQNAYNDWSVSYDTHEKL
jgi:hypothetical protein